MNGEPDLPGQSPSTRRWWPNSRPARWLLAATTFVVGLFAGGLIVGFVSAGPSTPGPRVTVTATPSDVPASPSATSGGLSAEANVNAACLRAVNDAQRSYAQLSDLVAALRSLDASRIDKVIQQLEPLQSQLQTDSHNCKIRTRLPDGSTTTTTPTGSVPSPSSS